MILLCMCFCVSSYMFGGPSDLPCFSRYQVKVTSKQKKNVLCKLSCAFVKVNKERMLLSVCHKAKLC
jgi:hypothetical protein